MEVVFRIGNNLLFIAKECKLLGIPIRKFHKLITTLIQIHFSEVLSKKSFKRLNYESYFKRISRNRDFRSETAENFMPFIVIISKGSPLKQSYKLAIGFLEIGHSLKNLMVIVSIYIIRDNRVRGKR